MRIYEYRHIVSFEETNFLGNVYYANHVRWQGLCREIFIREHAPSVFEDLKSGLLLVTVRCSCEYYAEVFAFDEIVVRMRLLEMTQSGITMGFDYVRRNGSGEDPVARGEQQITCMRRHGNTRISTPIPEALKTALAPYAFTASR
jgi:enediyne biosynthesis thioesterase